jgi:hypothetical protein
MSDTDWRISSILHQAAENFEKQSKTVEGLFQSAQEKFKHDYTGTTASVGILVIGASVYLAVFGKLEIFATAGLITGALLLVAALVMRHRAAESQVRNGEKMLALEQERARFTQKSFVVQQIWLHGLPEGTPLAQIQILMGDAPTLPKDSEAAQLTWKPLPAEASKTEAESKTSEPDA